MGGRKVNPVKERIYFTAGTENAEKEFLWIVGR